MFKINTPVPSNSFKLVTIIEPINNMDGLKSYIFYFNNQFLDNEYPIILVGIL